MDFSKIDLEDHRELARYIIFTASKENFKRRSDFERFRNRIVKEKKGVIFHNLYFIKAYNDLVSEGVINENQNLLRFIQKRSVRTLSGVAPVTVMTKPYPCPGRCIYCPTDVRMPKSYLPSQPAAQRAFRQRFNPYTQVFVRLKALNLTGHEVSKVELRIIGGSWSAYPKAYQKWFIKMCLLAMNEFNFQIDSGKADKMSDITRSEKVESPYGTDVVNTVYIDPLQKRSRFDDVVKNNETSCVRCIGINIETRPDLIDKKEVKRLRSLNVTKVEMGVQTLDDEIQKITRRGHTKRDVLLATSILKDAGFKVGYHMMPNLPGATVISDMKLLDEVFENPDYRPDYLKIYPCVVMPKTELAFKFACGEYSSYDDKVLEDILVSELKAVPEWCRIDRIARDIPSNEIESGFRVSNIRQVVEKRLLNEGTSCRDIRAREVKSFEVDLKNIELVFRKYDASGGGEVFFSFEDIKNDRLIALLRLRFPFKPFLSDIRGCALIREVHVYGCQVAVGKKGERNKQHLGWGSKLMEEAEKYAKKAGFLKMAVISGIGTREYYRKKGYNLIGSYMVKYI
jgi:elongator complex protein 3